MVAITVILAAVIGTFVLGLGDSLGDNQPTAQINAELGDDGVVTVEHNGGDSIESNQLSVIVSFDGDQVESDRYANRFSVGDTLTGDVKESAGTDNTSGVSEARIRVIHQSSDSVLLDRSFEFTGNDYEYGAGESFSLD